MYSFTYSLYGCRTVLRWAGHVARTGGASTAHITLTGRTEWRKAFISYRHRLRKWRYSSTRFTLGNRSRRLDGFTSRPLYPWIKHPCTHWIGSRVGSRAGLDAVEKRNNPSPCGKSNPGCPACSLVTIRTELS
jgi:hypothetical protein